MIYRKCQSPSILMVGVYIDGTILFSPRTSSVSPMMLLVSGIIAILAAICGFDLAQGKMLRLELSDLKVASFDGVVMGEWKFELSQKDSDSAVDIEIPMLKDLSPDTKLTFECTLSGTEIPPYEGSICAAIEDEMVGKSMIEAITPAIEGCPIKAGKYSMVKWLSSKVNIPESVPDGPFDGNVKITQPDGKPCIVVKFKGKLVRDIFGKR